MSEYEQIKIKSHIFQLSNTKASCTRKRKPVMVLFNCLLSVVRRLLVYNRCKLQCDVITSINNTSCL